MKSDIALLGIPGFLEFTAPAKMKLETPLRWRAIERYAKPGLWTYRVILQ